MTRRNKLTDVSDHPEPLRGLTPPLRGLTPELVAPTLSSQATRGFERGGEG